MSLSTEDLNALKDIVGQDPALADRLRQTADPAQAALLIMQTASGRGVGFDAQTLADYFLAQRHATGAAPISDDELEAVAGGATIFDPGKSPGFGRRAT